MAVIVPFVVALLLAAPALRLLLLAHKTRQSPELWAGIFFLGVAIGIPLRLVGAHMAPNDPAGALMFNAVGHAAFATGASALYLFVRRVFHPAASWAGWMVLGGIGAIALSTAAIFTSGDFNQERSITVLLVNVSRVAPIVWAFVESARYRKLMQRRAALGMGDAVVANRFLLWSLWTGGLGLLPLLAAGLRALLHASEALGMDVSDTNALQQGVVSALGGLLLLSAPVAIAALWLSFFPPKRYLLRLTAGQEGASA